MTGARDPYLDGARAVQGARDVFSDGARSVSDAHDPYTDGARGVQDQRSPYYDGAHVVAGLDRTGVSAPPARAVDPYYDGARKVGYLAPSVDGQAEAVTEALSLAGVETETVTYLETHGTGTPVGDPIEITALTQAFRTFTPRTGFCAIGSVKTNIGHLDTAAGVASLTKVV